MEETTGEKERRLEVANKVGEANLVFFSCFVVVCLMDEMGKTCIYKGS